MELFTNSKLFERSDIVEFEEGKLDLGVGE